MGLNVFSCGEISHCLSSLYPEFINFIAFLSPWYWGPPIKSHYTHPLHHLISTQLSKNLRKWLISKTKQWHFLLALLVWYHIVNPLFSVIKICNLYLAWVVNVKSDPDTVIETQISERRREKCQSGWEKCNSYIPISRTCCWLRDKYEQTWSNAWDVFALTVCRCYLERKGLITFFSVPLSIPELKQLHACYIFNQDKPLNLNQQTLLIVNYAPFCSSLSCFTILSCLIHMI